MIFPASCVWGGVSPGYAVLNTSVIRSQVQASLYWTTGFCLSKKKTSQGSSELSLYFSLHTPAGTGWVLLRSVSLTRNMLHKPTWGAYRTNWTLCTCIDYFEAPPCICALPLRRLGCFTRWRSQCCAVGWSVTIPSALLPRRSKFPMFQVSGDNIHIFHALGKQQPQNMLRNASALDNAHTTQPLGPALANPTLRPGAFSLSFASRVMTDFIVYKSTDVGT